MTLDARRQTYPLSQDLSSSGNEKELELDRAGTALIWVAVFSYLFCSQIAYNFGTFPVSIDFVSYAILAIYLLVSSSAEISPSSLSLIIGIVFLASFRIPFSESEASWSSLLLLGALYFPFTFRLPDHGTIHGVHRYILNAFIVGSTLISLIAIVQVVVINLIQNQAFVNIHFVLPQEIRSVGTYTYSREGAGFLKANGYFLRESSTLSQVAALGFILEYFGKARWRVLAILGLGLISSFSGSGILALMAGMLIPRSLGRIPVFIASLFCFAIIAITLDSLDIPYLKTWFDRVDELSTPATSGYARYVAPFDMVNFSFDNGVLSTWFGNGAGTYLRETGLLKVRYEINDPTWAKLIYEYGITGFIIMVSLLVVRLYSSNLRIEFCHFMLFTWFISGQLLKPDFALAVWLLSLVPLRRSTFRHDGSNSPAGDCEERTTSARPSASLEGK